MGNKTLIRNISVSGWVLIIVGSVSLLVTMFKSGLHYLFGLGFWGANGHDGIWHIALIENLAKGNWQMPIFAGSELKNYHIGFDLIVAIIHKITFIPVPVLYFQVLPLLLAPMIGVLCYLFVFEWTRSRLQAFWSTFFVYFGGSFGWVVTLFRSGNFDGESVFWSQQSISTLINPPFALSLLLLFAGLFFLVKGKTENSKKFLAISTFLFGFLIQVKVYAGLLILAGLFTAGVWELVLGRRLSILKVFTGSLIISILLFSPLNQNSQNQIIFQPFWFLENMMALSDRVGWERFHSAMMSYKSGQIYIKAFVAYAIAFGIFILGNFGTRALSLFWFIKKGLHIKASDYLDVMLTTIIVAGVLIPTFFVQTGSPWNTIQFSYYSLVFSGILSGIVIAGIIKTFEEFQKILVHQFLLKAGIVVIGICLITLPTTVAALRHHYLPANPPAKISEEEFEALEFLSSQPEGIVLTYPFDLDKAKEAQKNPPRPLYLYDSTAYVSAYGKKTVFLEDEVNLNITGYDWKKRRVEIEKFYNSLDHSFVREFLTNNDINYIYWIGNQRAKLGETQLGLVKIFENNSVFIYKVL